MKLRGESGGVPARMGGVNMGGARKRSNSATAAGRGTSKIAEPKSAVKVVPKGSPMQNAIKNNIATARTQRAKSGLEAKYEARQVATGKPKATVKINSARRTRSGNKAK
jgi:hypothetical protein